jgi:hypothetical protein
MNQTALKGFSSMKIALPKGHLQEGVLALFEKAGMPLRSSSVTKTPQEAVVPPQTWGGSAAFFDALKNLGI